MAVALIWLVVAVGLAAAEALTGDMFLLMLSGGALAAAGSNWMLGWPLWADGAVFLVVSVLLPSIVMLASCAACNCFSVFSPTPGAPGGLIGS